MLYVIAAHKNRIGSPPRHFYSRLHIKRLFDRFQHIYILKKRLIRHWLSLGSSFEALLNRYLYANAILYL